MSCDDLPVLVAHPWYTEPAVWFWIGVGVALLFFEFWAWRRHRRTPSQIPQGASKTVPWFRVIALTIWALLGFHLFFLRR